ncbi:NADP-dependent oxidoreductase [Noviherbaspirillum aerium]|uniref:NADP-dependent oxidoreductase n=1 Tax=Noviherbaspirillum aerium TaxID=2588497 RepID=UPI00124E6189|nr:NADP-dependent oxidoreductase [Noviherbaspirillum aerium]
MSEVLRQAPVVPESFQRVVLASRPLSRPSVEHFRVETVETPSIADGQVLVRNRYLSIDPYMLGRMFDARSYATPHPLGEAMIGETVGKIVATRHPRLVVGDTVVGPLGWQELAVSDGGNLDKINDADIGLSTYLGAIGMTGITAWYGMHQICEPRPGETVVVSGAAGAVGSVAVQLARERGCRVIGIAGGRLKCDTVIREFGVAACVDYRGAPDAAALQGAIAHLAPNGVDAFFDNVNGMTLDAVLPLMKPFGRIALCGMIARYGQQPMTLSNHGFLLLSRLRAQGFIVYDHRPLWPQARAELAALVCAGRLKVLETVSEGIASAPAACIGLIEGKNLGKQIVKLY